MHGLIIGGQTAVAHYIDVDRMSIRRSAGGHKIATFLRKNSYQVEVLDYFPAWTLEELQLYTKNIFNEETFFLGISSTFNLSCELLTDYLSWIRQEYPHITIFAGSQNSSMLSLDIDWYLYGYGEYGVLSLLKNIQNKTEPIHNNRVIDCNIYHPATKMDNLEVIYTPNDFMDKKEILFLEFARGCKFKCSFCSFPHLGVSEDRTRSAESVYDELLRNYEEHGIEYYMVLDETFNDRSEKIEKYARAIERLPFKPKMLGYIRADLLVNRKRDWDNLISMGFTSHFYGVESFNQPSAKSIGKGMNVGKLQDGLLEVKEYFLKNAGYYRGHISLIAGLPHETFDTLDETTAWLINNWSDQSANLTPLSILDNNNNQYDKISEIDETYEKFGYTKAEYNPKGGDGPDFNRHPFLYFMHYLWSNNHERVITWKNNNMDLYDALMYCYEKFDYRGRNDIFLNDRFFIDQSVDWSDFMEGDIGNDRQIHIDLFIEDYIEKKIKSSTHHRT
jgi:radical SAM superfamily enzyme YgiQ (UPF0313 family)